MPGRRIADTEMPRGVTFEEEDIRRLTQRQTEVEAITRVRQQLENTIAGIERRGKANPEYIAHLKESLEELKKGGRVKSLKPLTDEIISKAEEKYGPRYSRTELGRMLWDHIKTDPATVERLYETYKAEYITKIHERFPEDRAAEIDRRREERKLRGREEKPGKKPKKFRRVDLETDGEVILASADVSPNEAHSATPERTPSDPAKLKGPSAERA